MEVTGSISGSFAWEPKESGALFANCPKCGTFHGRSGWKPLPKEIVCLECGTEFSF